MTFERQPEWNGKRNGRNDDEDDDMKMVKRKVMMTPTMWDARFAECQDRGRCDEMEQAKWKAVENVRIYVSYC